jgi:hypothetical protein
VAVAAGQLLQVILTAVRAVLAVAVRALALKQAVEALAVLILEAVVATLTAAGQARLFFLYQPLLIQV